jgi:putative transposase
MQKHLKKFSLYQYIDRLVFDKLVKEWQMDKGVTKFKTWEMTCALIESFISQLGSYRDVHYALSVPRSTLGDALTKRSYGFFQVLCDQILQQIHVETASRKVKKAIREILAIDSTECRVHGSLFSLPGWKQKFCTGHKAAAKLHVVWNVCGEWIEDFIITPVRKNDSPVSLYFRLLPGKMYVFDRAYNDLSFWYQIMINGSDFVTRLKNYPRNKMKVIRAKIKKSNRCRILFDGIYKPTSFTNHAAVPRDIEFRHIIYRDPETGKIFHFVTSDFETSATTIAEIYRKRWAVELLFKWLKGHLNIRHLAVKSPNAVKVQLAIAVLVQLLLQLKKIKEKFSGTLWELLRLIRTTLVRESLIHSQPPDGCRWKSRADGDISL